MVVAKVVRVRNNTMRTFTIQAGDPFYTPLIDNKPCVNGVVEVPPGFDQTAEGLAVPWEALTSDGLVLSEANGADLLRCVVGPMANANEEESRSDWLQFRSARWEPVSQDRWLPLGHRHFMGAVGTSVDIQLTFRDGRSRSEDQADLATLVHFERAVVCASPNTVFLNVFDLAPVLSVPNAILCNTVVNTVGAFHAAVEVYGEEWSFYRTPSPTSCGVCKSLRPRNHPVHVYRQSINLGETSLKDWEVRYLIRAKLALKWPGGGYDLLTRNCIHFCDELLLTLGTRPAPGWVRGLHEAGASVLSVPWPLSYVFGGGSDSAIVRSKQEVLADSDVLEETSSSLPVLEGEASDLDKI
mmetsp:Transcript_44443/g.96641  ORF Transcript_44443/g.96641 Transcript_44443/m.96641 type:complete len:355 (+) Transcript_44443:120-1184(+)